MRSAIVDNNGSMFIWGEDFRGLRQRKPKHFYSFLTDIKQISFGVKHGLALTTSGKLFAWGDGTYGELGSEERMIIKPSPIPFFEDNEVLVKSISTGARHSLALDFDGQIYAFGDNSEDQCAADEQRCETPQIIEQQLKTINIFSGKSHNAAVAQDGQLYTWGGNGVNTNWSNPNALHTKLKILETVKGKTINGVALANDNTIIVTGGEGGYVNSISLKKDQQ